MLHSISWQQYFIFTLTATIIYYGYIWVVYYKAKFAFSVAGIRNAVQADASTSHVIEELRPLFVHGTNKKELITALQSKLKKYSYRNNPGFRKNINEFIVCASYYIREVFAVGRQDEIWCIGGKIIMWLVGKLYHRHVIFSGRFWNS